MSSRLTKKVIDTHALLHNLNYIRQLAPGKKIIAMVKASAYGCGLDQIIPTLDRQVDAFGVAFLAEALNIRALGSKTPCIVFQGVFDAKELPLLLENNCSLVLHCLEQLQWLLDTPLSKPLKVWVKVNTGMHRLGFLPEKIPQVIHALQNCSWVNPALGVMTHFASADEPEKSTTQEQLNRFNQLDLSPFTEKSLANSAGILYFPESHADVIRPGIMLYGVSPNSEKFPLIPVTQLISKISVIHHFPENAAIGYSGIWTTKRPSIIGIVACGYGDGYPRVLSKEAAVWIKGYLAPIVGRVSMDTLAIDVTDMPEIKRGDTVELWGKNLPVEKVATWAGTSAYELLCQSLLAV